LTLWRAFKLQLVTIGPRMPDLAPHQLKIALLQPEIAPNTGNIARLCVATGTHLHLVRPLGFVLSDKNLRRSAMDYWPRLQLTIHDDTASFVQTISFGSPWFFTSKSSRSLWDATFSPADCLIFGPETRGISQDLLDRYPERTVRIPQAPGERCLNLSTAAGIALYEALRQATRR
jgi:tRNA (cytidine/uridine-2'-O-)-methyltransferase